MDPEVEELAARFQSQEDEILQLRRQITDACSGEQSLLREKHVLEMKFLDLRAALSNKRIDAVSENMKELTLKKSYIEENLRLSDELKVLENENYLFTSSLLSLLTENGIRPPLFDASCLSNFTKRLYNQLHRKLSDFQAQAPDAIDQHKTRYVHDPSAEQNIFPGAPRDGDGHFYATDSRSPSQDVPFPIQNSEGGDDLPGIDSFQIIGDPKPGGMIRACGYPTNGTTSCLFEWFRLLQDGTSDYVEGAKHYDYVVTADDVDKILCVVCFPLDENGRQGEMVKLFANNDNPITCDVEMKSEIDSYVYAKKARFTVFLLMDSSEVWELGTLVLKKSILQIRLTQTNALVLEEKYSPHLLIKVPYGLSTQFVITSSNGTSYPLDSAGTSQSRTTEDDIRLREIIVLTARIFQSKALHEKRRPKT